MSRVVVAGAAGFLGSHLCRRLLGRGDEVVAIDNLVTGSIDNLADLFGHPGFVFQNHDVSNYVHVPGRLDAVLHLASPASPKDYLDKPIQTLKVGSLGTHRLLGLAKDKGATFFLASTSEVYGDPQVHPQREDYWGHVNPVGPRGVYDEAKRFAEAMTMAYHRYHGVDVRIVRIFNSILADEQVLYDDGTELRHETAAEAATRLGANRDLSGVRVPAFGGGCRITPAEAIALVAHPTDQRCYRVRTLYGRTVRVTGDHSLFVRGGDGAPTPKPVVDLRVGDRVAIARRLEVPERDRRFVDVLGALAAEGIEPAGLVVSWPGLGGCRADDSLTLDVVRARGVAVPPHATVRPAGLDRAGRSASLPVVLPVTDELLWLLGLWVAAGSWYEREGRAACLRLAADPELLDRAEKVVGRELGLPVVRAAGASSSGRAAGASSSGRAAGASVHSALLLGVLRHLGFGPGPTRVPGWVLGLPLDRLGWFLEGYTEGCGHAFTATSEALKDDLVVALARFGLVASVEESGPHWHLTLPAVQPASPPEWAAGVRQALLAEVDGDIVWAPVTAVEPVPATELVYDWSVPGRENFWAGSGVLAHNTYGPRMRPDDGRVVSNFIVQALAGRPLTVYGDGSQTRSFCYVDDEIRGFLALLDAGITGPVNIGNPDEFTVLELARMVIEVTGSPSEIVFEPLPVDDPTQRRPDITLATTALGWKPEVGLRDGLVETARWFRAG